MESIIRYFRVDRKKIYLIKFIFEAYEGVALLRTVDPKMGIIQCLISPGCEADAMAIIEDLSRTMLIEPRTGPVGCNGAETACADGQGPARGEIAI